MGSRFTRRRFLAAAGAGATYFALANTVGCEPPERSSKVNASGTPKIRPLPGVAFPPAGGVWAFRSRPDLNPPAVEVATECARRYRHWLHFPRPGEGRRREGRLDDNRRSR